MHITSICCPSTNGCMSLTPVHLSSTYILKYPYCLDHIASSISGQAHRCVRLRLPADSSTSMLLLQGHNSLLFKHRVPATTISSRSSSSVRPQRRASWCSRKPSSSLGRRTPAACQLFQDCTRNANEAPPRRRGSVPCSVWQTTALHGSRPYGGQHLACMQYPPNKHGHGLLLVSPIAIFPCHCHPEIKTYREIPITAKIALILQTVRVQLRLLVVPP